MSLLRNTVQRRVSAAIGASVVIGKLSVSLLGGSVEAEDVVIGGEGTVRSLVTIRRVRAEVSIPRALKGEIVIKSLTIESPNLTVVRHADGSTNLPGRLRELLEPDAAGEPTGRASDVPARGSGRTLIVRKALVVGGAAHLILESDEGAYDAGAYHEGAYHASVEGIMADWRHEGTAAHFTLLADSVGRRDEPVELGTIQASGHLAGATDLVRAADASAYLETEGFEALQVRINVPRIETRTVNADARGRVDLGRLVSAAPLGLLGLGPLKQLSGGVELSARASYAPGDGVRVEDLRLGAMGIHLPL